MNSIPLWQPSESRVEQSRLAEFTRFIQSQAPEGLSDYKSLHRWSIDDPSAFWSAVWTFTGIQCSRPVDHALQGADQLPGAQWFSGARLNYAENLLSGDRLGIAIVSYLENGDRRELTWAELSEAVAKTAAALKANGVTQGDRVAAMLPNVAETVIAMLATASIGAIWSSCSPDFGVNGVVDRFGQIEPKVLFVCDGYYYNGKAIDCAAKSREISKAIPNLSVTVAVSVLAASTPLGGVKSWQAFIEPSVEAKPPQLAFAQLPFDHPLFILFSSGTTGAPKCIVHGAGGTLLQHLKEHQLHVGLRPGDKLLYFTTCGWMMWNWMVTALASGVTLVLFDGSPFHPKPDVLFDIVDSEGVNVLGVGAKFISSIEKVGLKPAASHDLQSLQTLLSTGSPLSHESFEYVYRDVKADVCLSSISGGTDIISCFALGNECLPVFAGEIQCLGLGMSMDIFDEQGRSLNAGKGELVCTRPFPSAPLGFWNDPEGSRYHDAYFASYPGVWAHGDYAEITPNGGVIIHGRSDAILNPGGVRIGTAEIYRQVESFEQVVESVCIGQPWDGDVRVVLFVVLRDGLTLDEELRSRIKGKIRKETTPRHVPARIVQVHDVPRTRSGKIAEIAVRDVVTGNAVKNSTALSNPEALDQYRDMEALRT